MTVTEGCRSNGAQIIRVRTTPREIDLCYETFGDPTNEPLLCIIGLGAQMIAFREEFCNMLAQKYYVIRFDNRDCGLSSHLDDLPTPNLLKLKFKLMLGYELHESECPYTLKDMADDTVALMDALNLKSAHILGASMGGMIGQEICINYPERVRSFICIFSTHGGRGIPQASLMTQLKFLYKPKNDFQSKVDHGVWFFKSVVCSQHYWNEDKIREFVTRGLKRTEYRGGIGRQSAAILQANSSDRRKEKLCHIDIPTLLIHGDQDRLIPYQNSLQLHSVIRNSKLYIMDRAGHELPYVLYPDLMREICQVTSLAKSCVAAADIEVTLDCKNG